jgi:hypothetical protein
MTERLSIASIAVDDIQFLDRLAYHLRRFAGEKKEVADLSEEDRLKQREIAKEFITRNFPKPASHRWAEKVGQASGHGDIEKQEKSDDDKVQKGR